MKKKMSKQTKAKITALGEEKKKEQLPPCSISPQNSLISTILIAYSLQPQNRPKHLFSVISSKRARCLRVLWLPTPVISICWAKLQFKFGMGQALWCDDCIWFAHCRCVGVSLSLLFCNCWVCIPEALELERNSDCCKCGGCSNGCGYTCICHGHYLCIPVWLYRYSLRQTIAQFTGELNDIKVIGSNNTPVTSVSLKNLKN